MHRPYIAVFAAIFVAGATLATHVASVAAGSAPNAEQASFQTLLSRLDAAEKHHDLSAWAKLIRQNCTPDATFTQPNIPVQNVDQEIASERSMLGSVSSIKIDVEHVVQMTFSDNTAHAVVSYNIDVEGASNKPDLKQSDLLFVNLVESNGKWLIKSIDIKPGPVLNHGAPTAAA